MCQAGNVPAAVPTVPTSVPGDPLYDATMMAGPKPPQSSPFLKDLKKFGAGFAANGGFNTPQQQQRMPGQVQVMNDTPAAQGNPLLNSLIAQIMAKQNGGM